MERDNSNAARARRIAALPPSIPSSSTQRTTMATTTGPAAALQPAGEPASLAFAGLIAEQSKQRVLNGHDLDSLERAQSTATDTARTHVKSTRMSEKSPAVDSKPDFGARSSLSSGEERGMRICILTENFLPKVRTSSPTPGTSERSTVAARLLLRRRRAPHVSTSGVELTPPLPLQQVDGVTRTIAKLLEHLQKEGHEALVLGPEGGMVSRTSRLFVA